MKLQLELSSLGQIGRFYKPHNRTTSDEYKRLAELHSMDTAIINDTKLGQRIYDLLQESQVRQLIEFHNKDVRNHFADGEKGQGVCDDIEQILAILDEKLNQGEDHIELDSVSHQAEAQRRYHASRIASEESISQHVDQLVTEKATTGSIASLEDKIDELFEIMFTSPLDYVSCDGFDKLVRSLNQQELEKILDRLCLRCERIRFLKELAFELLTTTLKYHSNPSFKIDFLAKIFRATGEPKTNSKKVQKRRLFNYFQANFRGNEEAKKAVRLLSDDGYLVYAVSKQNVNDFLSS